jgi:hypothetical protein
VLREAGNVRPQVRATDADLTFGIGRDQGRRSWDAGISAQRSDVTLSTPGTVRAEPLLEAAQSRRFLPGFDALPAPMKPRCSRRSATADVPSSGRAGGACSAIDADAGGAAQLATGIDLRHERWTSHPDALLSQGDLALGLPQQQRRLSRQRRRYAELGLPLASRCAWTWPHAGTATATSRHSRPVPACAGAPHRTGRSCWPAGAATARPACSNSGARQATSARSRCPSPAHCHLCTEQRDGRCSVTADVVENDALKAERSRSHSLAATWSPSDAFSLSLTHNIVELRNEILALQPADAVWNRAPGSWMRTAT